MSICHLLSRFLVMFHLCRFVFVAKVMESISKETCVAVTDEQGNIVINNQHILLGNIKTQEYFYTPLTAEVVAEFELDCQPLSPCENKEANEEEYRELKIWTKENTLYLIETYKKFEKQFSCGIKKNIWAKVAMECSHLNKNITAEKCETKWKTLKRTYTNIKLHNSTSGKEKKYWEYYDLIHEILFKKPEIEAIATCSSLAGLHMQGSSKTEEKLKKGDDISEEEKNEKFESSFSKKRKKRIADAERRHQEKMQRLDTFNTIFARMVEKMPEKDTN